MSESRGMEIGGGVPVVQLEAIAALADSSTAIDEWREEHLGYTEETQEEGRWHRWNFLLDSVSKNLYVVCYKCGRIRQRDLNIGEVRFIDVDGSCPTMSAYWKEQDEKYGRRRRARMEDAGPTEISADPLRSPETGAE